MLPRSKLARLNLIISESLLRTSGPEISTLRISSLNTGRLWSSFMGPERIPIAVLASSMTLPKVLPSKSSSSRWNSLSFSFSSTSASCLGVIEMTMLLTEWRRRVIWVAYRVQSPWPRGNAKPVRFSRRELLPDDWLPTTTI